MLRKIQTMVPYVILMALTTGLFWWRSSGEPEAAADRAPQDSIRTVRTIRVVRGDLVQTFETTGTAESWAQVSVSPQLDGILTKVEAETAMRVRNGQLLAQLDDRLLQADLKQAEAALAKSTEQLARVEQLAERRLADRNRLQSAIAEKRIDEANVERLQALLSFTSLHSPIDGLITSETHYVGEAVQQGSELFSIADVSRLRIMTKIPEGIARKLRMGVTAVAKIDALGGREIQATVWRIHPISDRDLHQVTVELDAGSAFPLLQPGNLVSVVFTTDVRKGTLVLARSAVPDVINETETQIFRVRDGRAELRRVKFGLVAEDRVEVIDGLAEGDAVIPTGTPGLKDGDTVEALEEAAMPLGG